MRDFKEIKAIEQKVYTSYYKDGSLDLTVGLIMLFFALTLFASRLQCGDLLSVVIAFVPSILMYRLIIFIKRKITIPRLGTIVFSKSRKRKVASIVAIPVLTIVVGLTAFLIIPNSGDGFLRAFLMGSVFVVVFTIASILTSTMRLSIYGTLATIAFVTGKVLEQQLSMTYALPIAMLIVCLVATIVGSYMLAQFIKQYPVKTIGADNE